MGHGSVSHGGGQISKDDSPADLVRLQLKGVLETEGVWIRILSSQVFKGCGMIVRKYENLFFNTTTYSCKIQYDQI